MGVFKEIAGAILALSLLVFITLFGRIPTPVGYIYRFVWIYFPRYFRNADGYLFGGRLLSCCGRTGNYLMNENHPLVLIFFVGLLLISEAIFIPVAWSRLNTIHKLMVPLVALLPYAFLYFSVNSKSAITPENHSKYLHEYPYDNMIFHPNMTCRTCHRLKPARSKHCSLCKACVARHDHHCVWLRTCVGRNNYHYFLGLLLFTSVLLFYGSFLGYSIMDEALQRAISPTTTHHWSTGMPIMVFLDLWLLALTDDIQIGAITLLSLLCAPLSSAMLLYHIYLIWSGMTTNESSKWGEWRDDITDGFAYKAKAKEVRPQHDFGPRDEGISWPKRSEQTLVYTNGQPPRVGYTFTDERNSIKQPDRTDAPIDTRWTQVQSLKEIINIYDLGFLGNLRDSISRRN
ncbi:hypothetical protein MGYG_01450 [Nannizzia gypsea CBS 118893]|uniref:Palmitoyltransferase n=1 Tax=Arthroderma gypseum (strain ATCC MYA-4604 / CBS 118893) TaxID=535722 RepID=E5R0X8_ARTGP|nr:hypothetical protein MGYG_01450 [Nannizzia gypsea CBS 118893]EFQ98420.1 hypothetical protein MGYG_01450 [Nannizzia gypsea CBS 118893]